MRPISFAVVILLAAGPTPAGDRPPARPVDSPKPLTDEARSELNRVLRLMNGEPTPKFREVAMTLKQARYFADVPPKMTWQAEYSGWFVFALPDRAGAPDAWGGIIFVQKGTNLVWYYQESW